MSTPRKALFAVITVFFVFGTAELLLRGIGFAIQAAPPAMQFHVREIESAGYDVDPDVFWQLKSGFVGEVSENHPWEVRVNSRRMRGPELAARRAPGTIRILSLGDSSAFGWGVPEERSYARLLEGLLNERLGGDALRFEVLNAGVPGYSSFQGLGYLERDLLSLEPDVTLTYFGLNDFTGARFYSDREQALQTESVWSVLLKQSRIYQAMWRLLRAEPERDRFDSYFTATSDFRVPPEEHRENLREIQALVEAQGGRALFIRPTWRSPRNNRLYSRPFWLERDLDLLEGLTPVADAYAAFKAREPEVDALFLDVAHPSELGHALMAEVVYQSLVQYGMVPGAEEAR